MPDARYAPTFTFYISRFYILNSRRLDARRAPTFTFYISRFYILNSRRLDARRAPTFTFYISRFYILNSRRLDARRSNFYILHFAVLHFDFYLGVPLRVGLSACTFLRSVPLLSLTQQPFSFQQPSNQKREKRSEKRETPKP